MHRLERVLKARGWTPYEWAKRAGVSGATVTNMIGRGAKGARTPSLTKMAEVAGVSFEWLANGNGPMEPVPAPPSALASSPIVAHGTDPTPAESAVVEAYGRDPGRATPDDVVVAQKLAYGAPFNMPDDREAVVAMMGRFLGAVAKLRREGRPVTTADVMWELARKTTSPHQAAATEARDEALNAEARAELAEQGAEPPRVPVQAPTKKR